MSKTGVINTSIIVAGCLTVGLLVYVLFFRNKVSGKLVAVGANDGQLVEANNTGMNNYLQSMVNTI